jgi:hypothetical protein
MNGIAYDEEGYVCVRLRLTVWTTLALGDYVHVEGAQCAKILSSFHQWATIPLLSLLRTNKIEANNTHKKFNNTKKTNIFSHLVIKTNATLREKFMY